MSRTSPIVPLAQLLLLFLLVTKVLSQQTSWSPSSSSNSMPMQFSQMATQFNQQNLQGIVSQGASSSQQPFNKRRPLSGAMAPLMGKFRLLSTLFGGLRNSGLEMTIAGEILQRLLKTALRDVLVPFKSDIIAPMLPS